MGDCVKFAKGRERVAYRVLEGAELEETIVRGGDH